MNTALQGIRHCLGLGIAAGALETVALASSLELSLTTLQLGVLGVLAVLANTLMALLAGVASAPLGAIGDKGIPWQMAFTAGLLAMFYLEPVAYELYREGRNVPAGAMAAMPIGFAGVVYYNADYWTRRAKRVGTPRLGWLALASLGSLAVVAVTALLYPLRPTAGGGALPGDRSVVLVTVDTLRRDHVGAYGSTVPTPNWDRLAAEGAVFEDAVTPMPETRPAHASLLTGLHPLRHRVLSNGHPLSRGARTLAELLGREGYATGAFVSCAVLTADSGLEQGFYTYDDDFSPLPGALRIHLFSHLARAWMRWGSPTDTPWLYERDGLATVTRFDAWLSAQPDRPFFAWIHLFEPHAPYAGAFDMRSRMEGPFDGSETASLRQQYADEVTQADAALGEIVSALETQGLLDDVLLVVTADHGESLGENGRFGHLGLSEEVVRVPLVLRGRGFRPGARIAPQVRLVDVPETIVSWLEFGELESEGLDLAGYLDGRRSVPALLTLVGHEERRLADSALIGVRNSEVKYVRHLATGDEQLYDLTTRRDENVAAQQSHALETARRIANPEAAALKQQIEESSGPEDLFLKALGYSD